MTYHFVITISVCRTRRRWQRGARREFHTTSGHVKVPGSHTERAVYDRILEAAAQAAGVDIVHTVVVFFRLAPELAVLGSDSTYPSYPVEDEEPGAFDEHP